MTYAKINRPEKQELQRLTKLANQKRKRLLKKGLSSDILPMQFEIPNNASRQRINDYKDTLKSYTSRANLKYQYLKTDEGFVSKKAVMDLQLAQSAANRIRDKMEKRLNNEKYRIVSEEMQGITPSVDRTVGEDRFSDETATKIRYTKDYTKFNDDADMKKYIDRVSKFGDFAYLKWQDDIMLANFNEALENVFGGEAKEFTDIINKMTYDQKLYLFYTTDVFNHRYIYSEEEYSARQESVRHVLTPYK